MCTESHRLRKSIARYIAQWLIGECRNAAAAGAAAPLRDLHETEEASARRRAVFWIEEKLPRLHRRLCRLYLLLSLLVLARHGMMEVEATGTTRRVTHERQRDYLHFSESTLCENSRRSVKDRL